MNKANTILQITSEVLDRYRNSITRKAFTQAMERVIELVLGPGEQSPQTACLGLPKPGDGHRALGATAQRFVSTVSAGASGL